MASSSRRAAAVPQPLHQPKHPGTASGDCLTEFCGTPADLQSPRSIVFRGWIRTAVYGATEPALLWCCGLCATQGIALAEVQRLRKPADRAA